MRKPFVWIAALGCVAGAALYGCTSDESSNASSATDAGADTAAPPSGDSGSPTDAGADTGASPVTYAIPTGGGAVDVKLPSGTSLNFAFPASAGGTTVTFTPTDAASIGWGTKFADVVKMEPAGTKFSAPVIVKPSNNEVFLVDFASTGQKGPGEGLEYDDGAKGFKLFHFSTLAIVPPGVSCSSASGWNAVPNAPECTQYGSATTRLEFGCKAYEFCFVAHAQCCVDPASNATSCKLGDKGLVGWYTPVNSEPYCAGIFATDAGAQCGARICTSTDDGGTCSCMRDCGNTYRMECDGGSCACSIAGGAQGASFPQGTTCAAQYNMHMADSNLCNYP